MKKTILQMIKEDAKNVHVLIAEDDMVMQTLYHRLFDGLFNQFVIANNGVEAYEYFVSQADNPVDLIITDNYMPEMEGMELVQKIREKDFNVRILVMTSETDFNTMKSYMLNGVDAILPKPYDEELTMQVMQRTLHYINEKKLLESYIEQLEAMAKESVARKSAELKQRATQEHVPKLKKNIQESSASTIEQNPVLVDKYQIRNSVQDMENVDVDDLDTIGREKIDTFKENIADYEFALCSVEGGDIPSFRLALDEVLTGLQDLIRALNVLGAFPIAANAAKHLIEFVNTLDDEEFKDSNKRELFVDILLSMLGDFDKWIDTVFISRTAENVHYFDASFANTCLELEMIFKAEIYNSNEDALEFF